MAEEQAFPYSEWLAKLHPRYGVPWNMMLVVFVVEIVVGKYALFPSGTKWAEGANNTLVSKV